MRFSRMRRWLGPLLVRVGERLAPKVHVPPPEDALVAHKRELKGALSQIVYVRNQVSSELEAKQAELRKLDLEGGDAQEAHGARLAAEVDALEEEYRRVAPICETAKEALIKLQVAIEDRDRRQAREARIKTVEQVVLETLRRSAQP